jgi:hypothetical protein
MLAVFSQSQSREVEATEQKYRKLYEQAENPFTKFAHEVRISRVTIARVFVVNVPIFVHSSRLWKFTYCYRELTNMIYFLLLNNIISHVFSSRLNASFDFLVSQQKAQSIKSMSAADRLTLSASSFVLGRKPLRWALMAYALLLHALVFSALFFHTNAKCNATGAGAGAASGFGAGIGTGTGIGSSLTTSVAAAAGEGVKAIATRAAAAVLRRG